MSKTEIAKNQRVIKTRDAAQQYMGHGNQCDLCDCGGGDRNVGGKFLRLSDSNNFF